MTEEEASHAFDQFYQNSRHSRLNPLGIGVGLSICKQICQHLGGDIRVHRSDDGGCKFVFLMEVFEIESDDEEEAQSSNHSSKVSSARIDSELPD